MQITQSATIMSPNFLALLLTLCHVFTLFTPSQLHAQNCISGIINKYSPVIGFDCDSSVVLVENASEFSDGDLVLIIQMQGTTVMLGNDASFGSIVNEGSCGNFEFNRIASIASNKIRLKFDLTKPYDVTGRVQLVRVNEYADVDVCDLSCKPWDGSSGGVLAIDVSGTLTLAGDIDVSVAGFRGGQVVYGTTSIYHLTDYFYPPWPDQAASKGEGIAAIPVENSFGMGKAANGGGGGNAHNGGGGGGGNGGAGGNGGFEYYNTPSSPTQNTNGLGGLSVFGNSAVKAIMGGGGGSGHANDNVGTNGGNGGGIIIIKAGNIQGNNRYMRANGGDVVTSGNSNNDGQGGGGAGGTILIETGQITGALNCELKGGTGGDCLFYVTSQIIGGGGGGGGGKLLLSDNFSSITSDLNGGKNGISNQNLSNGAQPGQTGTIQYSLVLPYDTIPANPFDFVFDLNLTGPSCGNTSSGKIQILNTGLQAYSLNGGAYQNIAIFDNLPAGKYTLNVLLASGCERDTTIELLPSTPISNAVVLVQNENCKQKGSITINASSGTPPFEYSFNGGAWSTDTFFDNLDAGPYTLTIRDAAGCTGSENYIIQPYQPIQLKLDSLGSINCARDKGFIAFSASGGSSPYIFQLEKGGMAQTSGFFSDLKAGEYTGVVVDNDTCESKIEGITIDISVDSSMTFVSLDLCERNNYVFPNGDSTGLAGKYSRVSL